MFKFNEYLEEQEQKRKDEKSKTLHAFDMDETLFHHDHSKLKIHVKDKQGKTVHSLNNQEFNNHKLHPDHHYDFSEFRSTHVFRQSARPIHKMIRKLKAIHKNNKNVEIVTARSDLDDKHGFMKALKKHGIPAGKGEHDIHVRRTGNDTNAASPGDSKRRALSHLIKKHGYTKVHLYDDSEHNLSHFASLKQDHPHVELHAHHVQHDPATNKVHIKTTVYK
jgi:hypothetical protein